MLFDYKKCIAVIGAIAALWLAGTASAQNVSAGQIAYENNCFVCHGSPQFSSARSANTPAALSAAINSVNSMQFLRAVLSQNDINNIAAYIASVTGTGGGSTLQSQSITFPVLGSFAWNSAGITLAASASSGLAVSYSVLSGPCTIIGTQVTASGAGICTIAANQAGNTTFAAAPAVSRVVTVELGSFSDMWWAGSAQNGWGMSIQQHANNVQFNAIYVYDAQGQPRWYVMPGGTWNAAFNTYTGAVYQPTSAPFNNYNTAQFVVGAVKGTVTLSYTGASTMRMTYTIDGVSGTKQMERQVFGSGTAPLNVNDLWWAGPQEDGWGINFAQQQGKVFGVWYTYGADGKAFWYVLPDGTWTGNTYAGTLYATTGSNWFGTYDPSRLVVNNVGSLSVNFANANSATMTYTVNGITQTKNIIRQNF
jgi:cytochrome c553